MLSALLLMAKWLPLVELTVPLWSLTGESKFKMKKESRYKMKKAGMNTFCFLKGLNVNYAKLNAFVLVRSVGIESKVKNAFLCF